MTDTPAIDPTKPYLGWFDFYSAGWQAALVRMKDGERKAYRLGEPLPYERAVEMCQVLSETTGLPVAGELSKRDFCVPVSMGGAR